jgi:hypothetical protein
MTTPSYSEIRERLDRELAALSPDDARRHLVEHLTELTFEIDRIKQSHRVLLAALRARDSLVREQQHLPLPAVSRTIELDARNAFDVVDGLQDIQWDQTAAFRWSGPGHDVVTQIWLDRSVPIVFEVDVQSYGDQRNRNAVALTVDGVAVGIKDVGDNRLRSEPLPIAAGSLYTELVLHVPFLSREVGSQAVAQPRGNGRRSRQSQTAEQPDAGAEPRSGIAVRAMRFLTGP